jgi:hypothetical protein
MRVLKAGAVYFLLMFGVGWILGPIRELCAVPRFGRLTGVLLEAVIVLIAMAVSARWVIRRFHVKPTYGLTISIGLLALAILLPAEIAGVVWVRGYQELTDVGVIRSSCSPSVSIRAHLYSDWILG